MAVWIKTPDLSYVQISALSRVYVAADPTTNPTVWALFGAPGGGASPLLLRTNYATPAAAQAALDAAIAALGAAV